MIDRRQPLSILSILSYHSVHSVKEQSAMKITAIKTCVVNAEMRNWVFVKVETDQPGLYGWGEASLEWKTRAVVGAVEDFAPMLIGEDPDAHRVPVPEDVPPVLLARGRDRHVGHLRHRAGAVGHPRQGARTSRSIKLLGGAVRDRCACTPIWAAATCGPSTRRSTAPTQGCSSIGRCEVVSRGYNAVKVLITPPTESLNSIAAYNYAEPDDGGHARGRGRRCRHHGRLPRPPRVANAIEFCRVLAPYRPYFIEEPVPPENVDAMVEVRKASPVPIATGERLRHALRVPRAVREAGLPHHPARPVPLRRPVGGQEDRGDGRGLLHGRRAAQSAGAGGQRRRAALRPQHAQLSDPGRHADAMCRGAGKWCNIR